MPLLRRSFRLEVAIWFLVLAILFGDRFPSDGIDRERVRFDLQKDSFSSLSWSIERFRIELNAKFAELLAQLQQARNANLQNPGSSLDNAQLAAVLEDAVGEAKGAVSVEDMQECLLTFYRVSGLTNKFLELYAELARKNTNRVTNGPERKFLQQVELKSAATSDVSVVAGVGSRRR
jgi:hypothetical protein